MQSDIDIQNTSFILCDSSEQELFDKYKEQSLVLENKIHDISIIQQSKNLITALEQIDSNLRTEKKII